MNTTTTNNNNIKTTNMSNTNNLGSTLQRRFDNYDAENPEVFAAFKSFAQAAKAKGFKKYSAAALFQILRWETSVAGNDAYKINNDYHPYFARKLMATDANFIGFFRLRSVQGGK